MDSLLGSPVEEAAPEPEQADFFDFNPPAPDIRGSSYRTSLSPPEEQTFRSWYADYARQNRLNPDPDDPLHYYDYRGFWKESQQQPERYQPAVVNGQAHLPSEFKDDASPERYVQFNGQWWDSKLDKPAPPEIALLKSTPISPEVAGLDLSKIRPSGAMTFGMESGERPGPGTVMEGGRNVPAPAAIPWTPPADLPPSAPGSPYQTDRLFDRGRKQLLRGGVELVGDVGGLVEMVGGMETAGDPNKRAGIFLQYIGQGLREKARQVSQQIQDNLGPPGGAVLWGAGQEAVTSEEVVDNLAASVAPLLAIAYGAAAATPAIAQGAVVPVAAVMRGTSIGRQAGFLLERIFPRLAVKVGGKLDPVLALSSSMVANGVVNSFFMGTMQYKKAKNEGKSEEEAQGQAATAAALGLATTATAVAGAIPGQRLPARLLIGSIQGGVENAYRDLAGKMASGEPVVIDKNTELSLLTGVLMGAVMTAPRQRATERTAGATAGAFRANVRAQQEARTQAEALLAKHGGDLDAAMNDPAVPRPGAPPIVPLAEFGTAPLPATVETNESLMRRAYGDMDAAHQFLREQADLRGFNAKQVDVLAATATSPGKYERLLARIMARPITKAAAPDETIRKAREERLAREAAGIRPRPAAVAPPPDQTVVPLTDETGTIHRPVLPMETELADLREALGRTTIPANQVEKLLQGAAVSRQQYESVQKAAAARRVETPPPVTLPTAETAASRPPVAEPTAAPAEQPAQVVEAAQPKRATRRERDALQKSLKAAGLEPDAFVGEVFPGKQLVGLTSEEVAEAERRLAARSMPAPEPTAEEAAPAPAPASAPAPVVEPPAPISKPAAIIPSPPTPAPPLSALKPGPTQLSLAQITHGQLHPSEVRRIIGMVGRPDSKKAANALRSYGGGRVSMEDFIQEALSDPDNGEVLRAHGIRGPEDVEKFASALAEPTVARRVVPVSERAKVGASLAAENVQAVAEERWLRETLVETKDLKSRLAVIADQDELDVFANEYVDALGKAGAIGWGQKKIENQTQAVLGAVRQRGAELAVAKAAVPTPAKTYFEDLPKDQQEAIRNRHLGELQALTDRSYPFAARFGGEDVQVLGPAVRFEPYKEAAKGKAETMRDAGQLLVQRSDGNKFITFPSNLEDAATGTRLTSPTPPRKPVELIPGVVGQSLVEETPPPAPAVVPVEPTQPAAVSTPEAKEPWEMSADEFAQAVVGGKLYRATGKMPPRQPEQRTPLGLGEAEGYPAVDIAAHYVAQRTKTDGLSKPIKSGPVFRTLENPDQEALDAGREKYIRDALAAGKPVPASVLADYPDLRPESRPESAVMPKTTAATREESTVFLEQLHTAYNSVSRQPQDQLLQLTDLYRIIKGMPETRTGYTLKDFTDDLHRWNRSGVGTTTRDGSKASFSASTATKSMKNVLKVKDEEDGRTYHYYGVSFASPPSAPEVEPVAVEEPAVVLPVASGTPLIREVGKDFSGTFLHGTSAKNIKTLAEQQRPGSSKKKSSGNLLFDRGVGVELNEFGSEMLLAEPRQPHQAVMWSQGEGADLAVVQVKPGTKVLDLSDEATRAPKIGFGNEPTILKFFERPAITDDLIAWYKGRVSEGYKQRNPDWEKIIEGDFDPSSPAFQIRTWQENLVKYAKDRGYGLIRLADETLVTDRAVLESARPATVEEKAMATEAQRSYPGKGLYSDGPTGARSETPSPPAPTSEPISEPSSEMADALIASYRDGSRNLGSEQVADLDAAVLPAFLAEAQREREMLAEGRDALADRGDLPEPLVETLRQNATAELARVDRQIAEAERRITASRLAGAGVEQQPEPAPEPEPEVAAAEEPEAEVAEAVEPPAPVSVEPQAPEIQDHPEVVKALERSISKTWMKNYPADPAYRQMTDEQLQGIRKGQPKYVNDMTEEQKVAAANVYREQQRRHLEKRFAERSETAAKYKEFADKGQWSNGEPFPKVSDTVSSVIPGLFGMPARIEGTVNQRKDGTYYVKITTEGVGGAKTVPLTMGWRLPAPKPAAAGPAFSLEQQSGVEPARKPKLEDQALGIDLPKRVLPGTALKAEGRGLEGAALSAAGEAEAAAEAARAQEALSFEPQEGETPEEAAARQQAEADMRAGGREPKAGGRLPGVAQRGAGYDAVGRMVGILRRQGYEVPEVPVPKTTEGGADVRTGGAIRSEGRKAEDVSPLGAANAAIIRDNLQSLRETGGGGELPQTNREGSESTGTVFPGKGGKPGARAGGVAGPSLSFGAAAREDVNTKGYVDLSGKTVTSLYDAALIAQVFRDPRVEHSRYVYVGRNSKKVLAHEGFTSRIANMVAPPVYHGQEYMPVPERMIRNKQAIVLRVNRLSRLAGEPVDMILLHNHPSGNSVPSDNDIGYLRGMENYIPPTVNLLGQVIINSGEYSVVHPDLTTATYDLETNKRLDTGKTRGQMMEEERVAERKAIDPLYDPMRRRGGAGFGTILTTKSVMAAVRLGHDLKMPGKMASFIYLGVNNEVKGHEGINLVVLRDSARTVGLLKNRLAAFGATRAIIYYDGDRMNREELFGIGNALAQIGLVTDAIFLPPNSTPYSAESAVVGGHLELQDRAPDLLIRIAESNKPYDPDDPDSYDPHNPAHFEALLREVVGGEIEQHNAEVRARKQAETEGKPEAELPLETPEEKARREQREEQLGQGLTAQLNPKPRVDPAKRPHLAQAAEEIAQMQLKMNAPGKVIRNWGPPGSFADEMAKEWEGWHQAGGKIPLLPHRLIRAWDRNWWNSQGEIYFLINSWMQRHPETVIPVAQNPITKFQQYDQVMGLGQKFVNSWLYALQRGMGSGVRTSQLTEIRGKPVEEAAPEGTSITQAVQGRLTSEEYAWLNIYLGERKIQQREASLMAEVAPEYNAGLDGKKKHFVANLKKELQGTGLSDSEIREEIAQRSEEEFAKIDYRPMTPETINPHTAAVATKRLADLRAEIGEVAYRRLQATEKHLGTFWGLGVLKYLRDGGVISRASYDKIRESNRKYGEYVGKYKVFKYWAKKITAGQGIPHKNYDVGYQDVVMKAEGTTLENLPILDAGPGDIYAAVAITERNKMLRSIYDLRKFPDFRDLIRPLKEGEEPPEGFTALELLMNGERRSFALPDEFGAILLSMDRKQQGLFIDSMRFLGRTLRSAATLTSPTFAFRQVPSDMATQWVGAEDPVSPLNPKDYMLLWRSFWSTLTQNHLGNISGRPDAMAARRRYRQFLGAGAAYTGWYDQNKPTQTAREIATGYLRAKVGAVTGLPEGTTTGRKVWEATKQVGAVAADAPHRVAGLLPAGTEGMMRQAVWEKNTTGAHYRRLRELWVSLPADQRQTQGKNLKQVQDDLRAYKMAHPEEGEGWQLAVTQDDLAAGALNALNGLINFRMGGTAVRQWTQVRPFTMSNVGATRTFYQGAKKYPVRAMALGLLYMIWDAALYIAGWEMFGQLWRDLDPQERSKNYIIPLPHEIISDLKESVFGAQPDVPQPDYVAGPGVREFSPEELWNASTGWLKANQVPVEDYQGQPHPAHLRFRKDTLGQLVTAPLESVIDYYYTGRPEIASTLAEMFSAVSPVNVTYKGDFWNMAKGAMADASGPFSIPFELWEPRGVDYYRQRYLMNEEQAQAASPSSKVNAYTSGGARLLGEAMGVAPIKVDHLSQRLLGQWGPDILRLAEVVTGKPEGRRALKDYEDIASLPIIRGFYSVRGGNLQTMGHQILDQAAGQIADRRFRHRQDVKAIMERSGEFSREELESRLQKVVGDPESLAMLVDAAKKEEAGYTSVEARLRTFGEKNGDRAMAIAYLFNKLWITGLDRSIFLETAMADPNPLVTNEVLAEILWMVEEEGTITPDQPE